MDESEEQWNYVGKSRKHRSEPTKKQAKAIEGKLHPKFRKTKKPTSHIFIFINHRRRHIEQDKINLCF